MSERPERCDKCRWWDKYDTDAGEWHFDVYERGDATGHCRRYPPSPSIVQQVADSSHVGEGDIGRPDCNLDWAWPATVSGDFCGEFTPRQEKE